MKLSIWNWLKKTSICVDDFYKEDVKIRGIIAKVSDYFGVNEPEELWLNNNVANLNRIPPKTICETAFRYSNLIILVPPLLYILGMKLESGRDRDRQDTGDIIKEAGQKSGFFCIVLDLPD